jgi:hypothetical protein
MKKIIKIKILVLAILLIGIMIVGYNLYLKEWLVKQDAIDRCLDKGGRWNYENNNCEFE